MEKSSFDRLLKRYLTGQVTEEERIKLEAWLDVIKTENANDLRLSKADEDKLFQQITSSKSNIKEIEAFRPERKKISMSGWIFRVAAGFLAVALVSYAGWRFGADGSGSIEVTSNAGVRKVILEDGSLVWLKGESKLVYYEKEDEGIRYAALEGEALFEVAKDPTHPFVIRCGSAKLKVLGTSFSIRSSNDSLELKVLTGLVNLSFNADSASIDVSPNEKAMYTTNGKVLKQSFDKIESNGIMADTEYDMRFTSSSLEVILASLQKKFDVTIQLANRKAGNCRLTVDLTDHSLEKSLQMIAEVLDVTYARHGGKITMSGEGCK